MSYRLTIQEKPPYLHAMVTGTHSARNIRRFLVEVHDAGMRRNYSAVLLEMNLSGPSLATASIFDVVSERSRAGSKFARIAYVDTSSERDPRQIKFAETVAVNRGVSIRFFRNLDDAERWIVGSTGETPVKGGENKDQPRASVRTGRKRPASRRAR